MLGTIKLIAFIIFCGIVLITALLSIHIFKMILSFAVIIALVAGMTWVYFKYVRNKKQ